MKLSCLPVSFFEEILTGKMTLNEWAYIGAEAGLDAVDLSILFLPELTSGAASRSAPPDTIRGCAGGNAHHLSRLHPSGCHAAPD